MTDQPQAKKGMSKGCMVGLIVVGVMVVMIAAAAVTCYMKRDALMKFGITTSIESVGTRLETDPIAGIDTEQFKQLSSAFLEKFAVDTIDLERASELGYLMQDVAPNDEIGAKEVNALMAAMITFYPDLAETIEPVDEVLDSDTAAQTTE